VASKICILDDDPAFSQDLRKELADGYEVIAFPEANSFRAGFAPRRFELVVLDMRLELAKEGLEILREIQRIDPYQTVAVATAYADTETYLEALQAGALLYVDKTRHTTAALALLFDAVIQQGRLRREQAAACRILERMDPLEMVGASEPIRLLRARIDQVAQQVPRLVVLVGETGSGRELVARNLHAKRFKGMVPPLSVLPRQNVPSADIHRLLAGNRTVTGRQHGLLEDAHGAGLVVRCSDRLPRDILAFLLAAHQSKEFRMDSDSAPHPLDAALYLVCEQVEKIRPLVGDRPVEIIHIPPLRDRKEDIPLLTSYLIEEHRKRGREGSSTLDPSAMSALLAHDWPGNVAELKIALEYGSFRSLADGSEMIRAEHLPTVLRLPTESVLGRQWDLEYREARSQVELVEAAITELATTNKTRLAGFLHIQTPTTLTRRIERALDRYPTLRDEYRRTASAFLRLERQ
jgi:DNA-binding NtrC family response regulator